MEVPQLIEREVPVDRIVEKVVRVPMQTIKEVVVEKVVERVVEVPKIIEKVVTVERIVEVPVEVVKEVVVEKIVEVVKEVIKEVPVPQYVERVQLVPDLRIVEVPVEVERVVTVPVEVFKEVPVVTEVVKEVVKEVWPMRICPSACACERAPAAAPCTRPLLLQQGVPEGTAKAPFNNSAPLGWVGGWGLGAPLPLKRLGQIFFQACGAKGAVVTWGGEAGPTHPPSAGRSEGTTGPFSFRWKAQTRRRWCIANCWWFTTGRGRIEVRDFAVLRNCPQFIAISCNFPAIFRTCPS